MNEEEVSETLERVVPHRDVPTGLLAGARRRRRNSRTLAGAAALAVVAAIAIPLGLGVGGQNQPRVATPAPVASSTAASAATSLEPDVCRDEDGNYPEVTTLPGNELPLGVEKVWLCGGPSDSAWRDTYVGPPEPLTLNADWAVAAFMETPSTVGSMLCETNNSIGFTVVYEYPNGESHAVQGSLGGCDAVVSSGAYRMGAGEYLDELQALWDEQRSAEDTSFDADVKVCPGLTSVLGVEVADMTRAYACGPIANEDGSTDSVQIPLSDELVSDIVDEITSQDVYVGIQPGVDVQAPSLVLLSATGDPYAIQGTPEGYSWYDPEPTGMNVWTPSRELAARIYAEMTRDGTCTAPDRLVPSDVTVDVYDAGAGSESVQGVVDHLSAAGFRVTNTQEMAVPNMGGPIIIRGGPESIGMGLVESQFTGVSGELSREDAVVDVLVTAVFNEGPPSFALKPLQDIASGSVTCTAPVVARTPDASSTPAGIPSVEVLPGLQETQSETPCEPDDEGRMAPTNLPNNTLPDGPMAVWLCNELRPLTEPLVGKEATQQVVDSFNKLPTSTSFDSYPTPGHAYVVAAYADGRRYIVEMETRSSDKVVWGSERQHVRYGGDEWIRALEQLWVDQRNDTPQSPALAPKGGVCENLSWNLGRTIDRYAADGALCTVVVTDSGSRAVEVPATPSLIEEFRTEAQKSKIPGLPPNGENPTQDWPLDIVVLVDDYGDRLSLIRGSGDPWYWREGNDTWEWTPSPDLAARLAQAFEEGRPSPHPTHS